MTFLYLLEWSFFRNFAPENLSFHQNMKTKCFDAKLQKKSTRIFRLFFLSCNIWFSKADHINSKFLLQPVDYSNQTNKSSLLLWYWYQMFELEFWTENTYIQKLEGNDYSTLFTYCHMNVRNYVSWCLSYTKMHCKTIQNGQNIYGEIQICN